jgi:hypothetical protein
MKRRALGRLALVATGVFGVAGLLGQLGRRWGATAAEARQTLAGDELVPDAMWDATRAITIAAPPAQVWPWLVQMGYHRAGWYTLALIDNQGTPHPNRIVPELQHLVAGEVVPDAAHHYAYWIAARVQPPTTLVYTTTRHLVSQRSLGPDDPIPKAWYQASWSFVLEAPDPDTTRLLVRWRMTWVPRWMGLLLMWLLLGPGDLLMQRKLLRTIRRLVEATPSPGMSARIGTDALAQATTQHGAAERSRPPDRRRL